MRLAAGATVFGTAIEVMIAPFMTNVILIEHPMLHTGSFFGFRNRTVNTATTDISYDNFEVVAVPEPASLGLIGLAGLPLLRRRGRAC